VALNALGNLARSMGDYDAGRRHFAEALVLRRAAGDRREIAMSLSGMGTLALFAGDESGRGLIEQAVQIFDRTEDGPGQQLMPLNLAAYELDHGDPRRAYELLDRVASLHDDVPIRGRGWAEAELAEAAIAIDDSGRAQRALAAALTSFDKLGETRGVRHVRTLQARLERMMSGC
jgi:tetratricopeptide (TPR) repeat protein